MFSWNSALTVEIASRARVYARDDTRRNQTVAMISGGRIAITASVSCHDRMPRTTSTPKKLMMLTSAWMMPVCSRLENASTSVVMRVMMRPAISRS